MSPSIELIRKRVREVPDFPQPGILFRDITPVLADPQAFNATIALLSERYRSVDIDHFVAIESRGFLFAAPLAIALGKPLHLIRKPGKLPWNTEQRSYALEYGTNALEIQLEDISPGGKTIIIDDLLATGGTAAAAIDLVRSQSGVVIEAAFIIELVALNGRARIDTVPCFALLEL